MSESPRHQRCSDLRDRLARKGRLLAEKQCGGDGRSPCAEGFARHQLRLGRVEAVDDLIRYLDDRIVGLGDHDPEGRLPRLKALRRAIRDLRKRSATQ